MLTSLKKSFYIGRFAPSPTGPLHLGSLFTALASFLEARSQQGSWLLRIEDLDPPREQAGATAAILDTLQAHGLQWDGDVIQQSQRCEVYQQRIQYLLKLNKAFYCQCSRRELTPYKGYYPKFCRHRTLTDIDKKAIRFLNDHPCLFFEDTLQGKMLADIIPQDLSNDFIIQRRDKLFAYQLAVVIDDIEQGVTAIMRGSDILDSTYKQIALYQAFQQAPPSYSHLPVITASNGQKLSKTKFSPCN